MVERKKELVVKTEDGKVENRYSVELPTVDQLIEIESLKLILSKGKYTEMILSGTKWMERALNFVDMCAYLSVMCPPLLRDMKVDIRKLDTLDARKGPFIVYQEQFVPWWKEYEQAMKNIEEGVQDNLDSADKGKDSKDDKTGTE